jgi:hypothetical protein
MPDEFIPAQGGEIRNTAPRNVPGDSTIAERLSDLHKKVRAPVSIGAVGWRAAKGTLVGLVGGWLIGALWWIVLAISLGPSTSIWSDSTGWHEETITVFQRAASAPLVAIPWAVVGAIVGLAGGLLGDRWTPLLAFLGMMVGGGFVVLTAPLDGWLTLTMPVFSLGGTFIGLVLGILVSVVVKACRGDFRDW